MRNDRSQIWGYILMLAIIAAAAWLIIQSIGGAHP